VGDWPVITLAYKNQVMYMLQQVPEMPFSNEQINIHNNTVKIHCWWLHNLPLQPVQTKITGGWGRLIFLSNPDLVYMWFKSFTKDKITHVNYSKKYIYQLIKFLAFLFCYIIIN
jgi:hypothetical protein